jgi:glucosamine-phosphate N-acetyltransferase
MAADTPLFSADLVSPEVQSAAPEGYKYRPLQRNDYANGHLDPLRDLAYIGDITEETWTERFDLMKSCPGTYYILVIEDASGKIVGTGTLVVERKL